MLELQGFLNTLQVSLAEVMREALGFAKGCLLGAWAGGGCGDAVSEAAMVLFWSRK